MKKNSPLQTTLSLETRVERLDAMLRSGVPFLPLLEELLPILSELTLSERKLDCIQHTLGFMRLRLLGRNDGSGLYCHFWNNQAGCERHESIHNHMCALTSVVLSGSVTNRLYTIHRSPKSPYVLSAVRYNADGTSARVPGQGGYACSQTGLRCYCPGEYYKVELDEFHTSEPSEDIVTITLVSKGPALRANPEVLTLLTNTETTVSLDAAVAAASLLPYLDHLQEIFLRQASASRRY